MNYGNDAWWLLPGFQYYHRLWLLQNSNLENWNQLGLYQNCFLAVSTNYNITLKPTESPPSPFSFDMVVHCSSQLSMVQWLSSSIFPCLSFVVLLWWHPTKSPYFQHIHAWKPYTYSLPLNTKQCKGILTQYHQVLTSTTFFWPSTITIDQ